MRVTFRTGEKSEDPDHPPGALGTRPYPLETPPARRCRSGSGARGLTCHWTGSPRCPETEAHVTHCPRPQHASLYTRPPLRGETTSNRAQMVGRDGHERAQGMAQPSWYLVRSLEALTGLSRAETSRYWGAATQTEGGEDPRPPPNRRSPISTMLALPTALLLLGGGHLPSQATVNSEGKKLFSQLTHCQILGLYSSRQHFPHEE